MNPSRLALALVLGATVAHADNSPSEAVFPEQKLPLKFSHKQHLGFKLQCDFCHETAESSVSSSDRLIPTEESCETCHKIDRAQPQKQSRPAARCDACHAYSSPTADLAKPPPALIPAPNLKFNHKVHVDRKIACQRCHGEMKDIDLATRAQLPRMALCLGCHNATARKDRAPAKCTTCHLPRPDGTLETTFASGRLMPSGAILGDAHTLKFATEHAAVASQNEKYCRSCHRQDFCLACHNGVVKPMSFHGNDYVSIHPIDARKATLDCNGCHRRQTFCLGCHERAGITDGATVAAPNGLPENQKRFHPPTEKWVNPPRTPEHHSWQAERNLRQCISCHRENTCLQCHSTFTGKDHTFNISPHPALFTNSRQCQALAARNSRVCLKCHATDDPHLTCR